MRRLAPLIIACLLASWWLAMSGNLTAAGKRPTRKPKSIRRHFRSRVSLKQTEQDQFEASQRVKAVTAALPADAARPATDDPAQHATVQDEEMLERERAIRTIRAEKLSKDVSLKRLMRQKTAAGS